MRNEIEYNGWKIEYLGEGVFKYQGYYNSPTLYNIYTKQAKAASIGSWTYCLDWADEAELAQLRKLMFNAELEEVLK